jgi:hypothetical protein
VVIAVMAVMAVRMVEATVDEVIDVVTVRHRLVSARDMGCPVGRMVSG